MGKNKRFRTMAIALAALMCLPLGGVAFAFGSGTGFIEGIISMVEEAVPRDALETPAPEVQGEGSLGGSIIIEWPPITGATAYDIFGSSSQDGEYKLIGTSPDPYYIHSSLNVNTEYWYKVRAVSVDIVGELSAAVGAKTAESDEGDKEILNQFQLTYDCSTDEKSPQFVWNTLGNADVFNVYRATYPASEFVLLDSVERQDIYVSALGQTISAPVYHDATAEQGNIYYYGFREYFPLEQTEGETSFAFEVQMGTDLVKPITSTGPTNTAEPTDTSEPTNTEVPTDTSEPTDTVAPTDTVDPTDTTEPTNSEQPTDTSIPTTSVEPTDPSEPVNSIEPTEPLDPSNSPAPTNTEEPSDPIAPTDTMTPTDTDEPTDTATPTETADPTDTTEPTDTFIPTHTVDPTATAEPTDPAVPSDPSEPTSPAVEQDPDLSAPGLVEVKATEKSTAIQINWTKVEGAIVYHVYRASTEDGAYTRYYSTPEESILDHKNLEAGSTYWYKVCAESAKGLGEMSPAVQGTANIEDTSDEPMELLTIAKGEGESLLLTWDREPVAENETVHVYRASFPAMEFEEIHVLDKGDTVYQDEQIQLGSRYFYYMTSTQAESQEERSNIVSYITPAMATPIPNAEARGANSMRIYWEPVEGATSYMVSRNVGGQSYEAVDITFNTEAVDTGLEPNTQYTYSVHAINNETDQRSWNGYVTGTTAASDGTDPTETTYVTDPTEIPDSTSPVDTTDPTAPIDPSATPDTSLPSDGPATGTPLAPKQLSVIGEGPQTVLLKWKQSMKATSYNIYRSESEDGNFELIGSSGSELSYIDENAPKDATIYYMVKGENELGEGLASRTEDITLYSSVSPAVEMKEVFESSVCEVNWSWITNASDYSVYRAEGDGEFELLCTTRGVVYSDANVVEGKVYTYKIVSSNGAEGIVSTSSPM